MKFHYKAQAKIGAVIEDTIEAENKDAVIEKIRESGAIPILVEEEKKKGIEISIPFLETVVMSKLGRLWIYWVVLGKN